MFNVTCECGQVWSGLVLVRLVTGDWLGRAKVKVKGHTGVNFSDTGSCLDSD